MDSTSEVESISTLPEQSRFVFSFLAHAINGVAIGERESSVGSASSYFINLINLMNLIN